MGLGRQLKATISTPARFDGEKNRPPLEKGETAGFVSWFAEDLVVRRHHVDAQAARESWNSPRVHGVDM